MSYASDLHSAPSLLSASTESFRSSLPDEGMAPSFDGATTWLNPSALGQHDLAGKVVLVDFWTYSCINCIRTLPYVKAWAETYKDQGLVVVGVHSPEFAFEKKVSNVSAAVEKFDVQFPVAVDSDFKIWRAFRNAYWPAFYLVDAKGRVRFHQFGEGAYDQTESAIQDLLKEAGSSDVSEIATPRTETGEEAQADYANIRSNETYLGYGQASGFVSPGGAKKDSYKWYSSGSPGLNQWGLDGGWTIGQEAAVLDEAGGGISIRFSARDLHLVLGPQSPNKPIAFQILLDGKPPGENHGSDTDAQGNGMITQTRLYQLVRQSGGVEERNLTIRFLEPGAHAFVFTFG